MNEKGDRLSGPDRQGGGREDGTRSAHRLRRALRLPARIRTRAWIAATALLIVLALQYVALAYALKHNDRLVHDIAERNRDATELVDALAADLHLLNSQLLGAASGIEDAGQVAEGLPATGGAVIADWRRLTRKIPEFLDATSVASAERAINGLSPLLQAMQSSFAVPAGAGALTPGDISQVTQYRLWLDIRRPLDSFVTTIRDRVNARARASIAQAQNAEMRLRQLSAVVFLVSLVGILAIWAFLVYGIARPIGRLVDAMRRLAIGDTSGQLPGPQDASELGDMARAVAVFRDATIENRRLQAEAVENRVRAERMRLEQAERERLAVIERERRIEAAARAEALGRAHDEAVAANRTKTEFLANMSHELRTPLNAIIGLSELMRRELFGPVGNTQYRGYIEDINTSGAHLLSLIDEILDLSKIEAGRVELRESEVDLSVALEVCLRLVRGRADAAGLSLEHRCSDALPEVRVDPVKLKQILLNLLSNAVKFTPRGGRVSVRCNRAEDGGIEIAVEDTGIGMRREDIPIALEPFRQIDRSAIRPSEGTGLGLPLACKLAELHGATLQIDSTPGKGTRVAMRLPADRVVEASAIPTLEGV